MSELIFKRGVQVDLPSIENRDMDAFYVVTDAKKMHLGDITWEDTESVKEEIKQIIADNELTVAASLTELKESKLDASAHTESINTLTETFNGEIEEVQAAIESVSDNVTALTESVNNSIDGVSGAVTSLTEEVIKNETTVAAALTKLNEGKLDISAYTEITDYVSSEELTTILEPYAKKTDMDNVSGQVENLQDQMSAVTEDIEGIQESIETLSGHVLDNELVIAASLTDLEERKLNVDDYQPITDYVNQETFDELMSQLGTTFGDIDTQFTEVNAELNKKVAATTIKTLSGISLIGEGENISIKTINNESIFGEGNIAIDLSLFQVVAELPVENFDTTKVYVVPSATSGEGNIYSEYVFLNGVWEKVGEYNSTVSLDGYATEAWVNEQGFALSSTVESLQEEVLKNETTVAAALTKLHRDKMDASAFTEAIASYVTSEDLTTTLTDYATVESVNTMASTKLDVTAYTEITDYVHVADYEEFSGEVADALNQVNSDLTDIQSNINVVSDLALSAHTEIERITQELIDDELAIAAAVKELHEGKLDISAYTEDMKSYATKEDLESIDLSEYATKEDLESIDLSEYATNASVNEAISAETAARQEAISAITVEIIKDEKTIAAALTKLNEGKLDISAYTASASNFITSDNLTSILEDYVTEGSLSELGYATVEDVENLSGHVLDNEVTIAAALTELKNTKLDITSLDAQLSGYVNTTTFETTIENISDSIEQVDSQLDDLSGHVLDNEVTIAAALTHLNQDKVDASAMTEYLGAYATTEAVEGLNQHVLDNELVVAAALTDLEERKLNADDYQPITDYINQETFDELMSQLGTTFGNIDSQIADVNEDITSLMNAVNDERIARAEAISGLTQELLDDEMAIAAALTELEESKMDNSAFTEVIGSYATLDNVDEKLVDYVKTSDIEGVLSGITQNIIDNEQITAQAIADLAETKLDKFDLPSFDDFATKEDLENVSVDLSDYATKEDLENVSVDLSGYVTLEAYNAKVTELTNKITTLETTIQTLTAEVEENETVAAAAISLLDENKVSIDKGADVITIKDTAGVFSAATVEGALKELYDMIQSLHNNA